MAESCRLEVLVDQLLKRVTVLEQDLRISRQKEEQLEKKVTELQYLNYLGMGNQIREQLRYQRNYGKLSLTHPSLLRQEQNWEELLKYLGVTDWMNSVDLSNHGMGDEKAQRILEAVKKNGGIRSVKLSDNKLGGKFAESLGRFLETDSTLRALDLSGNNFNSEGMTSIAESLRKNTTLQELSLAQIKLDSSSFRAMAEALRANRTLVCLDLQDTSMGPSEADFLIDSLKSSNSALQTLSLQKNPLGATTGLRLASWLGSNPPLVKFDISSCELGNEGIDAIVNSLEGNTTLKEIILSDNNASSKLKEKLGPVASTLKAKGIELLV